MTQSPRKMIETLVGFPTVSRDSNLELIHFVRDYLAGCGVDSHIVPNEDATKANLYATVGPHVEGGIVLSGHTDVVPVDGQPWDTDPFEVVERGGRLYGRGTCDMKSFSAIALALGARHARPGAEATHPLRVVLRRGGGLPRCSPHDCEDRGRGAAPRRGHRRRADLDEGDYRAQGHHADGDRGHRPRGALEPDPSAG